MRLLIALIAVAVPPSTPLDRVRWLAGCLEARTGDTVIEEAWLPARGRTMLGMGRTTTSTSLIDYELAVIRGDGDALRYEAHPSGKPPAVFTATVVTADSVIFEHPTLAFPRHVSYRRAGRDSVVAWIDGTSKGTVRRIEFPYRRVACPSRTRRNDAGSSSGR
jgi:hypothetical protein